MSPEGPIIEQDKDQHWFSISAAVLKVKLQRHILAKQSKQKNRPQQVKHQTYKTTQNFTVWNDDSPDCQNVNISDY